MYFLFISLFVFLLFGFFILLLCVFRGDYRLLVFAVYDSKAGAYLPPFFAPARGVGLRQFQQASRQVDHPFHEFGADFTLFELGSFDESTGKFDLHDAPDNLGNALMFSEGE